MQKQKVGTVVQTWVYPVKGMQGIQTDEITVKSISVAGDRRVAFTETDANFTPTLLDTTKFQGLLRYIPRFVNKEELSLNTRFPISVPLIKLIMRF